MSCGNWAQLERVRTAPYFRGTDPVAQLAEHLTFNQRVPGSNPGGITGENAPELAVQVGFGAFLFSCLKNSSGGSRRGNDPSSSEVINALQPPPRDSRDTDHEGSDGVGGPATSRRVEAGPGDLGPFG